MLSCIYYLKPQFIEFYLVIQNIEETCGKIIVLFFCDVVNLRSMKTFLQECRFFKISVIGFLFFLYLRL